MIINEWIVQLFCPSTMGSHGFKLNKPVTSGGHWLLDVFAFTSTDPAIGALAVPRAWSDALVAQSRVLCGCKEHPAT